MKTITVTMEVTLEVPFNIERLVRNAADLAIAVGAKNPIPNREYLRGQVELIAQTWGPNVDATFSMGNVRSVRIDPEDWLDHIQQAVMDAAVHIAHP